VFTTVDCLEKMPQIWLCLPKRQAVEASPGKQLSQREDILVASFNIRKSKK
jgi:hypothetical protein